GRAIAGTDNINWTSHRECRNSQDRLSRCSWISHQDAVRTACTKHRTTGSASKCKHAGGGVVRRRLGETADALAIIRLEPHRAEETDALATIGQNELSLVSFR